MAKTKNKIRFAADWEVDALAVRIAQLEKEVEELKRRPYLNFDAPALSSRTDYSVALASRPPENITRDLPPMPRGRKIKKGG